MRVLWVHTFNTNIPNSGNFMYHFLEAMSIEASSIEIELFYFNKSSVINIFNSMSSLRSLVTDFDIVHFQYGSFCMFISSFIKHDCKIVTLRGSDWHRLRNNGTFVERIHSKMAVFLTHVSMKSITCVVAVSQRISNEVHAKFGCKPYVIIDPINDIFFQSNIMPARHTRDQKVVLLNSIDIKNPIKNLAFAQRIIKIFNEESNAKLDVITCVDMDIAGVKETLKQVDCLLLTSEYEGWPNCVKEALACCVPVVATDVSDLMAWSDRLDGLFCVSSAKELDFVNALKKALHFDRNRMLENIPKLKAFQAATASEKLSFIYNNLCDLRG